MRYPANNLNSFTRSLAFVLTAIFAIGIILPVSVSAHMQPTTMILLDVGDDKVGMEVQIPLTELELAFGQNVTTDADTLVERKGGQIDAYVLNHIHPVTIGGQPWLVNVVGQAVSEAVQTQSGPYREIVVRLDLTPPAGASTRNFILNYDLIIHQVVTHKALVAIRKDWETGLTGENTVAAGVIQVDTVTTKIFPLEIALEKGSLLTGFAGMVALGMSHIKDGTDHLLFLFVLLLPAPLIFVNGKWDGYGGTKYSVVRLLKIVTAFTIGHSITLLIASLGLLKLPQQPIEVLIAVSILLSAAHAIRPLFPGKEMFVAAGFGLVHGLAFATVLADLNLGPQQMALSILGFNVGIEIMQFLVIALTMPWLMIIALTHSYKYVRLGGAGIAAIAAAGWIAERVSGQANAVGDIAGYINSYGHLVIIFFAVIAILTYSSQMRNFDASPRLSGMEDHSE